MNKKILSFIAGLFLSVGVVQAGYASIIQNWSFDFDPMNPSAGMVQINNYIDVASPNTVEITMTTSDDFTFVNEGTFDVVQHDGQLITPYTYLDKVKAEYSYNGDGSLASGSVNFTSGQLDLFYESTRIATLDVVTGHGDIDDSGAPDNNETFTIHYQSSFVAPGYFWAPDGTDMVSTGLRGFTTTNANMLSQSGNVMNLASNGQFFLVPVPVPSAILMFSCGIIGLVGFIRKNN